VLIDGHGLFVRIVSKRRGVHGGQVSADHEGRAEDHPERYVRALLAGGEPGLPAKLGQATLQQMISQVRQGPNQPSAGIVRRRERCAAPAPGRATQCPKEAPSATFA
jgi:hypothetical protein